MSSLFPMPVEEPTVAGRRVRLRRLVPGGDEDLKLVAWRNDPELKEFFFSDDPVSLDSHRAWLTRLCDDESARFFGVEALVGPGPGVSLLDTPLLIGTCGLNRMSRASLSAEISWILIGDASYRGGGYGKEMMFLLIDHAFTYLGLHKLWSEIIASNARARQAHASVGFREEGLLREQVRKDGRYIDVVRAGLLAEEFATIRDGLGRRLELA